MSPTDIAVLALVIGAVALLVVLIFVVEHVDKSKEGADETSARERLYGRHR